MIVVSVFTKAAPEAQLRGLTFGSISPEDKAISRASWGKWDVIHSAIIVGITIAFYIYFW